MPYGHQIESQRTDFTYDLKLGHKIESPHYPKFSFQEQWDQCGGLENQRIKA